MGVDIFFVISGFLITGIVSKSIKNDQFSIVDFYSRRINRIFPALLIVLGASLLFSWFVVLPSDFQLVGKHVAGGGAFVQNLVLYGEVGYFDSASKLKPLLHLWSLGIEEQFYLVLPVLAIALCRRPNIFVVSLVLFALASFAINIFLISINPAATFYFPITRAWELLAGGMIALVGVRSSSAVKANVVSLIGIMLIAFSMLFINERMMFPGWLAVLPVAGASMLIIAGPDAIFNKYVLSCRPLFFVGLISYPLYLWHWPLLSFSWLIDSTSRLERLGLVAAAFILAWLTYRVIECPIRASKNKSKISMGLLLIGIAVALGRFSIYRSDGYPERGNLKVYAALDKSLHWDYASNSLCAETFGKPQHMDSWMFCYANSKAPSIAIIGNSFANHLYPGLANNRSMSGKGILSIGVCDPSAQTDWGPPDNPLSPCAYHKADLERKFLNDLVRDQNSIRFVILNSWWPNFDKDGGYAKRPDQAATKKANIFDHPERYSYSSYENYFYGLSARISTFEKLGKTVVIFAPKPELGFHIRECIDRPLKGRSTDCTTDKAAEYAKQEKFREGLQMLKASHPNLKVYDPFELFCDEAVCRYFRDGKPLLRDDAHLSEFGSEYVMNDFVEWAKLNVPGFIDDLSIDPLSSLMAVGRLIR